MKTVEDIISLYLGLCELLLDKKGLHFRVQRNVWYKGNWELRWTEKGKPIHTEIEYVKDACHGLYFNLLDADDRTVSGFKLIQMPGCCGICISTGCFVANHCCNKGVGNLLHEFRKEISKCLGYTVLMCTDRVENTHQLKILDKNGWKHVHQFNNKRTGNDVNISIVTL